ncbi:MAG TPA: ATP-binding protein [Bryobacteraceae bacterium]|nr:ATP-binding protein [Bryobacteraceae bacterium]
MRSRSWPALFFGFGGLVLLVGLASLGAARRATQIYTEMASIYEAHRQTTSIFGALRSDLNLSGIYVRDYLLDPSDLTGAMYRQRLLDIRAAMTKELEDLQRLVGPEQADVLAKLREELDGYWDSIDPLFSWTPRQKMALSSLFLRQRVLPRRDAAMEIARGISDISDANFKIQQRRLERGQAGFRSYLAWMLVITVSLGLLVAGLSVHNITRLERESERQQRRTVRAEQELRRLSQELVRTQEAERRSISRELHDQVGQTLTALRMELANLSAMRDSPAGEFQGRLQEAKHLAEQTLVSVRDMAMGLRPAMLDDLGLAPALEWQGRDFSRRSGIPVDVEVDGSVDALPETHRTCVFRIVQEALTNCARHAHAKHIRVTVHGSSDAISLSVQDDGAGFAPEETSTGGLGLMGIEERARELGGVVRIRSQVGKGTTLQAEIPLPRQAPA